MLVSDDVKPFHSLVLSPHSLKQEWSKRAVEDLLSQLSLPESETQDREVSTVGAKDDLHMERSVENNNIPPKERKSSCKNFYWKGRTSC